MSDNSLKIWWFAVDKFHPNKSYHPYLFLSVYLAHTGTNIGLILRGFAILFSIHSG